MRSLARLLPLAFLLIAAGQAPQPVAEWKGEFFLKKQGGLYFKAKLKGKLDGQIQVTVWSIIEKKLFLMSKTPGEEGGQPRETWKLPSGKYEIKQIVVVDTAGAKRTWKGADEKKSFGVKRQCLSNLGLWTVAPDGKAGLKVSFDAAPNSYKEEGPAKDSSVAAVIDGFTGLIQEKIGGKKVLDASETDHSTNKELRATITFTRQIAMFYKLDLFRHNYHAKAIANVLSVYDPNIRKCYTDRLEWNDSLRGDVKYTFLLSKQTGTMSKLKHTGGTMGDPKVAECVYYELAQIQFPVPENMVGELTYTYDVK